MLLLVAIQVLGCSQEDNGGEAQPGAVMDMDRDDMGMEEEDVGDIPAPEPDNVRDMPVEEPEGEEDVVVPEAMPPDMMETPEPEEEEPDMVAGCGLDPGGNDRTWSIQHGGIQREFIVHMPQGYDPGVAYPVVVNFHGRALNAQNQDMLSSMGALADEKGFIAVHPEGTGFLKTWNAELCCGEAADNNIDDVGFVDAMLDRLEAELCVDRQRIYAAGISNGGYMSYRLACELSGRVAAIAPVAGVNLTLACEPSRAVPVFHFHGLADTVVPFDGRLGVSVDDSIQGWLQRNACDATPTVFFEQDDVRCEEWSGCTDSASVRLCVVDGGGHTWPGGMPIPFLGETTQTISASRMMWDFFVEHPMP